MALSGQLCISCIAASYFFSRLLKRPFFYFTVATTLKNGGNVLVPCWPSVSDFQDGLLLSGVDNKQSKR